MGYSSRHHSSLLHFEIDESEFDVDKMRQFFEKNKIEYLMAYDASVTKNGRNRCIAKKKGDNKFNYVKGSKSAAKQMKVRKERQNDAVTIFNVSRNERMPDSFFNLIDPDQVDEKMIVSFGRFAQKEIIKSHIKTTLTQNKNRQVCSVIKSEGALAAIESGALSVGQLKSAKAYEAEVAEKKQKDEMKAKDLDAAHTWSFECFRTGRTHTIVSHNDEVMDSAMECQ